MASRCRCQKWKKSAAYPGGLTRMCESADHRLCGGAVIRPRKPGYYSVVVWVNPSLDPRGRRAVYAEVSTLVGARGKADEVFQKLKSTAGMAGCAGCDGSQYRGRR